MHALDVFGAQLRVFMVRTGCFNWSFVLKKFLVFLDIWFRSIGATVRFAGAGGS